MNENKIHELVFEVLNKLGNISYDIENIHHIKFELGRMADDALQKEYDNNQQYFLWDNHHKLQISSNYLHQVFTRLNEDIEDVQKLQSVLFEITKRLFSEK